MPPPHKKWTSHFTHYVLHLQQRKAGAATARHCLSRMEQTKYDSAEGPEATDCTTNFPNELKATPRPALTNDV